MLATSDRDRPCSARTLPSSLGRVTLMTPSLWATSMGSATSSESFPLGPVTVTSRPLMATSTPLGIGTGMRPIRDISVSSPDVGEDFPAYAALDRLLEARDRSLTGRPVFEQDHEALADLGILDTPAGDVALPLEDLRDVNL